jgi:hypothetical protein
MTRPTVLFIAGMGRSGSTLIDRTLGEVPGYHSLGEVTHLWRRGVADNQRCGSGEPFDSCPFWTKVGHVAFGGWDRMDADEAIHLQRSVDRTRHIPLLATARFLPGFRNRVERYASMLGDVYRAAAEVSGARVLIDSSKHASSAYLLRHVSGISPAIAHLVRDPRAVAHAWTKVKAMPDAGPDAEMARYSLTKSSALYTVHNSAIDLLRATAIPYVKVRYEDFTVSPEATLRRILGIVGDGGADLDHLTGQTVRLGTNHNIGGNPMKSTNGEIAINPDHAWRERMPRSSRYAVTAMTLPSLVGYGYGPGILRRTSTTRIGEGAS